MESFVGVLAGVGVLISLMQTKTILLYLIMYIQC
jgi:hypothetical protein